MGRGRQDGVGGIPGRFGGVAGRRPPFPHGLEGRFEERIVGRLIPAARVTGGHAPAAEPSDAGGGLDLVGGVVGAGLRAVRRSVRSGDTIFNSHSALDRGFFLVISRPVADRLDDTLPYTSTAHDRQGHFSMLSPDFSVPRSQDRRFRWSAGHPAVA